MPSGVVKLIGALTVAVALMFAAPQLARAQQRAEVSESKPKTRTPPSPEDLQMPAPTGPGETLVDRGDGVYGLAGEDAGADGSVSTDAGAGGGSERPPPPLDDASCSVAGGGDAALLGFLLVTGLLFRRRDD